MIISEKQIMQLIMVARGYMDVLIEKGGIARGPSKEILKLIETIMEQQSKKLKVIE